MMTIIFAKDKCSAYVAEIIDSFQSADLRTFLGRTSLQKIAYFCVVSGVPIPCSFEIYNFGPYSEEVTKSISRLMADDAINDISNNRGKYSNYRRGDAFQDLPSDLRSEAKAYRSTIDMVVNALGSYRPETLELIATLHFINARMRGISGSKPDKAGVLLEFEKVKGRKFKLSDVESWYDGLDKAELL